MKTLKHRNAETLKLNFVIAMIALVLVLSGCNPKNEDDFVQEIVLQGQMYVGQPPQIRLTHTIPFGAYYDSMAVGISGANVTLTAGGQPFHLVETSRGPGYYGLAPGDTHTVTPGMHYEIRALVDSTVITAETNAAGILQISSQNLDTVMIGVTDLVLRWPLDPFARGYWAIFENLNPYHEDDSTLLNTNAGGDAQAGIYTSYWSMPPSEDSLRAPRILFNRDGLHRVRVFSCDSSLWYYSSTWQPGQVKNYPISNVHGGLGIFTVGGVDTTYFVMAKNPNLKPR